LGAAGTSQYYPPEILRAEFLDNAFRYEKTVSSKSDVWAFGLMIWEIFTQKKAWKDLLDEIQWNAKLFSEELCDRARLPEMEKSIPPQIVPIIVSCLKTNGDDRPSFSQLVDRLISAQIDYFLHKDEVAIAFWKNHWIKNNWDSNNKVSWDKFQDAIKSFLKMTENSDVDVWNTLKARLVTDEGHVTLSSLEKVICWFGPIKSQDGDTIFQRIQKYFATPGIHFRGPITSSVTESLLQNQDPGTFFIRLNEGGNVSNTEAPWTLSIHTKKKAVKHHRIHLVEGGLVFKSSEYPINTVFPSLFKLIEQLKHDYPKDFAHPLAEGTSELKY
jgi:serine/threonine protein kinase